MTVINIEHLKYRYPGTEALALDDVSLTIEAGEFIGIVGANGAGKSTLSQAMIGLVPQFHKGAYGGSVRVYTENAPEGLLADKVPVSTLCEHVGLIFQNPFNQLSGAKDTVYGEVAFGLQNLGIEREEMKRRIETVLKQLDIWEYRDRNPFDLSGGQMQRVAIASILVMQPQIIILDEPTSQLDPQGSEEVFKVVDQLTEMGITIIMIEQKLEKLAKYCDRLILMKEGKMVAFDTPDRIFSRDDLDEAYIQPPVFTRLCKRFNLKNADGTYPATAEGAKELFASSGTKISDEEIWALIRENVTLLSQQELEAAKDTKVFTTKDLCFSYLENVPIFEKLNIEFDKRPTAIIGQNGAGKTTLVRLLKGLLKPVSGEVLFYGENIADKTVAMLADKVGYVFQNPDDQIFKYNVLDEVMFGPLNIGMSEADAKASSLKALELMGLSGKENENPYDLELHERKMVAIASVVAMDTDVIVLDEPTIAQDYKGRSKLGQMIRTLSKEGKLVIAILHDMDFVAESFERVIVMAHGKVLTEGVAEEVFAKDDILTEARLQKPYYLQL